MKMEAKRHRTIHFQKCYVLKKKWDKNFSPHHSSQVEVAIQVCPSHTKALMNVFRQESASTAKSWMRMQVSQADNFVNLAKNSPLVWEVTGSKRSVFDIRPLLQGQVLEASMSTSSGAIIKECYQLDEQVIRSNQGDISHHLKSLRIKMHM